MLGGLGLPDTLTLLSLQGAKGTHGLGGCRMGDKPKQYPGEKFSGPVYLTVSHLVLVPRDSDYVRISI